MDQDVIKCRIGGADYVGTFQVRGYILTLSSDLGTIRASVGLTDPKKLAKQLLRVLHKRQSVSAEIVSGGAAVASSRTRLPNGKGGFSNQPGGCAP